MKANRTARSRYAVLLAGALLTSACASIPDLGPKPMPRAASEFVADKSFAAPRSEWPADGWWRGYGDAQLNQIMEQGLAGSPDLAAASARLRAAEGYAQQANAATKPRVDGFAIPELAKQSENTETPSAAVPDGWNDRSALGVSFSLDLDLWGKNRAASRAAKAEARSARYEFDEARLAITTGIASTYAKLASLYAQRDSIEAAIEIRSKSADLTKERVDIGLDTQAEARQATARVAQSRADLEATDEAIELTKNALAELVGAGPDRALSIGRPGVAMLKAQGIPADASTNLVGRRADIAALRARVEAAAEQIKVARASFYPSINLTALVGLQSFGLGNLLSGGSTVGSVAPAVSLPIFHGGALQGQYRGRRGQYDEAVALYDASVIKALRQTADAVTSQKKLVSRLSESRSALADFRDAHRLARLRYEQGLSTYLDVLSAEEGVVEAQLQVSELETRAFTLDVQLVRALGGGFTAA